MRVLGLITARGGSKGIPRKNIKDLAGRPLISYVAQDALSAKFLDRVILSTDDEEIAQVARNEGIDVPFMRPKSLSQDASTSADVIIHAINFLEEAGDEYDAVCLLQPTSPFKPIGFIDKCIERFKDISVDTLISVLPVPHEYNPHWVFEENDNGLLRISTGEKELVPRRQELPPAFYRDGSVYVFKVKNIINNKCIVYGSIAHIQSDQSYYCNLDTLLDWQKAENYLKNRT